MSIEPESSYRLDDAGSSDDGHGTWRDHVNVSADIGSFELNLPLIDIDVSSEAQSSQTPRPSRAYADRTVTPGAGQGSADDHWVLPAQIHARDIFGSRQKSRIATIQQHTSSFIMYNETYNQVDIWGDQEAIAKCKHYLDGIVQRLQENDVSLLRKTKKWERPERQLTEREQRRAERRQAKVDEERRFQGLPVVAQKYHAVFPLPDNTLPVLRFTGQNESYFNQIRADCKAFIWFEENHNVSIVRIASDNEESVNKAATRVRNWYLRSCRKPMGGTLRLMEQPTAKSLLVYRNLPSEFVTFQYTDPKIESMWLQEQRMLETTTTGVMKKIGDLIEFYEDHSPEPLSDQVKTMNARNERIITEQLAAGLESLRLNDWMIRMKFRFGHICLIEYPKKKEENKFMSIEYVSDKLFRKPGFKSKLAPCISKTFQGLDGLFQFLANEPDVVEFTENPRTSFAINATQYSSTTDPRNPGQKKHLRGDKWETVLQISFTDSGQCRLWSTITDCTDLVDISMANIESRYSWDLKLQYARRLPNNDVNLPHEKFARGLRVSKKNNRLIMVVSTDYVPELVTQKTKWQYSYKGYIIEVCQDEVWDIHRVKRPDQELPVDLSMVDPHRTLFKVSLYKETWVNRFAENLNLQIGEAPSWSLRDFLAMSDENAHTVMEMTKKLAQVLNVSVPLYWINNRVADSLV